MKGPREPMRTVVGAALFSEGDFAPACVERESLLPGPTRRAGRRRSCARVSIALADLPVCALLGVPWAPLELPYAAFWVVLLVSGAMIGWAAHRLHQRRCAKTLAKPARERELCTQRALWDAAPVAIAALDTQGRVWAWNLAAERLLGTPRAEVLGRLPPTVTATAEAEAKFRRLCTRVAEATAPSSFETEVRRSDGRPLELSIVAAPLLDEAGQATGLVATLQDVSGRRQAEAARARLVGILEATPDFVGTCDLRGRITYLNRAGRTLVGLRETEDLSTLTFADLLPDPVLGRWFEEVVPAAERTGAWSGELALRERGGGSIPVWQVVLAHRDTSGKLAFYSSLAHDLRKRLEAEVALRHAEEQLRQAQKMEAIGRLAGGIAHDFNNLLTVVLGAGALSLAKLPKDHPVRPEILEMMHAGERAATLTRQLLAFSRKQETEAKSVDVNELIVGLDGMLGRMLGESIRIEQHLSDDLAWVRADKGQIEQVIINLALNARDSMTDGGLLTIETSHIELGPVSRVAASDGAHPSPGAYVQLTVRDTGAGMSSEMQARIFEPFFTTKGIGKGTGLGLSTVYGIVKQSGGFISVQSARGAGTSFHVYLPKLSERDEPVLERQEEDHVRGGDETILLVEDDDRLRELARRVLTDHGYRVLCAADAEAAWEVSRRHGGAIHLLLSDVVMPGKPGPVLARELRHRYADLKVLFMSGYTEDTLTGQSLVDAEQVVLSKPFVPRVLAQRVREVLDAGDARPARWASGSRASSG